MVRTPPSTADRHLIDELAAEGRTISASQLERWRHEGLLPAATVVREGFGGSSVAPHDESVLMACRELAELSVRGRPWPMTAIDVFNRGFDLSTSAVRSAALYDLERATRPMRRAWQRAEAAARSTGEPDDEVIADIATAAARSLSRGDRRLVAEEVRLVHPFRPEEGWATAVERALIWRTADIVVPWRLTPEQRSLARHGVVEPMDPLRMLVPLPSERHACVQTLTWAEADVAREWAIVATPSLLDIMSPLAASTWIVTAWRFRADPDRPDRPVSEGTLSERCDDIESAQRTEAEEAVAGAGAGPLDLSEDLATLD